MTIHIHLIQTVSMSGAIPLLLLYAFMVCTGKTSVCFIPANIIRLIRSNRISLAGRIARMGEKRNAYGV
jgi:hypothetical protein